MKAYLVVIRYTGLWHCDSAFSNRKLREANGFAFECTFKLLLCRLSLIFFLSFSSIISSAQQKDYSFYQKNEVIRYAAEDDSITVFLLKNLDEKNECYSANLVGNVCLDSLCRPVDIDIYWDLLGNFSDYQTSPKNSLTKFDHMEFTKEDHMKLKNILADSNSILRDYEMDDLVDTTVKVVSLIKLDAITGATNPTFEGAIVPGAVYTVYKLWHFVNSDIRSKLLEYSKSHVFTDHEIKRLLLSANKVYQYFLIDYISKDKVMNFKEELITLISDKDDYVSLYALDKLPDHLWNDRDFQLKVLSLLSKLKDPVRASILSKLSDKIIRANELSVLVKTMHILTPQHLQMAFKILKGNKAKINSKVKGEIKVLLNNEQQIIREYTSDFLMEF